MSPLPSHIPQPEDVEQSYRLTEGIYLLGSLERGVTVYKQQVRAHNLVWALWEIDRKIGSRIRNVAIVGGGISGLTVAACILSRFSESVNVSIFEQLWDFCPIQQGADARWLHPRIYNWPEYGSRAPGASLPVLNWSEGRASDVARSVIDEFAKFYTKFDPHANRLSVILGLQHFQIQASTRRIEWMGTQAVRRGNFFHLGPREGRDAEFDIIILSAGFGIERVIDKYRTPSYWRNEQIAQPILDGTKRRFVVSGYGDGALVDLCRLSIERFRQDSIVYELFGPDIDQFEQRLRELIDVADKNNMLQMLKSVQDSLLADPIRRLSDRIRKDTEVLLHVGGTGVEKKNFSDIFGPRSSVLNRILTFLLFRCGAYSLDFGDLTSAISRHQTSPENVLCRYGADTIGHICAIMRDSEAVLPRLREIQQTQKQDARRLWKPGTFRTC